MTLVMAYCILLSAALASVATLGDHVLRSRAVPTRRLWLVALLLVVPITGYVMLAPRSVEVAAVRGTVLELPLLPQSAVARDV